MSEFEMKMLIEELEKIIITKQSIILNQGYQIENLKKENEHLNEMLTPKKEK